MEDEIYRRLAEHLDRLPGGFAPSETGAELRLLRRLFTPEEAALAVHLTLEQEAAPIIAARAGLPAAEVEERLDEMARKGLILSAQPVGGLMLYQAVPFVVGIYEFQVNNLNPDLLNAIHEYWSTQKRRQRPRTIPQMRTIPVGRSIEPHLEALPYEQVHELIAAHDRFAVSPCICRRHAKMRGAGCEAPEELCLSMGDLADYTVRGGRGRYVDRAEMLELLAKADAANLVLQPSNSQDAAFICCCCGCCCGVLRGLQQHSRPADVVASAFIARLEPESCQGCWTCLERCQMQALVAEGDRVALKAERCIGCGLCVSTCPSGALTLQRKPAGQQIEPPATIQETWRTISRAQAQGAA